MRRVMVTGRLDLRDLTAKSCRMSGTSSSDGPCADLVDHLGLLGTWKIPGFFLQALPR